MKAKLFKTKLLLAIIAITGFISCSEESVVEAKCPDKVETKAKRITDRSILMKGTIIGEGEIKEKGFVYSSTNTLPVNMELKVVCSSEDFSSTATELDQTKTYYVCSYVIPNNSDIIWGNVVNVASGSSGREVKTNETIIYNKDGTVTVKGSVTGANVTARGFVYSDQVTEPVYDGAKSIIIDTYVFSTYIPDLLLDTDYYVRAFAVYNEVDTVYGNVVKAKIALTPPTLSTLSVANVTSKAAVVCGRFTDFGNMEVTNYGLCLSSEKTPTIENGRKQEAPDYDTKDKVGLFGVFFDDLNSNTTYYVRSYAVINKSVIYGDIRSMKTVADDGGQRIKWQWGEGEALAKEKNCHARIVEAMDSAMIYYRKYSNLTHNIKVSYNEGVATADCNILGSMRFGKDARYQWVGTAQHEISHAMGVGQAWNWKELIQFDGVRNWKGEEAVITLRVMMKDMTQELKGDATHFWNGGINQREEVTNGTKNSHGVVIKDAEMLKCNAMVLNAMRIDGLSTSW